MNEEFEKRIPYQSIDLSPLVNPDAPYVNRLNAASILFDYYLRVEQHKLDMAAKRTKAIRRTIWNALFAAINVVLLGVLIGRALT